MPNIEKSQTLLLCRGKDCLKKANDHVRALTATAEAVGLEVGSAKCQGACSGPTAVVIGGDGPRWFSGLQGPKVQRDLCNFAAQRTAAVTKRLAKHELRGKKRQKAAKRLAVQR